MHKNNSSLRESISEYTSDNSHIPRTREVHRQLHQKNLRPISIDYLEPNTASVGSVYTNPFEAASQKENNYTKKYSQSRDFNVTNVTRDSGHATRSSVSKSYGQHSQKYHHRLGTTLHDNCNNNPSGGSNPFRKTEPTNSLSLHPEVGSIKEFQRNCIVHNEAEIRQRQNLLNAVNQLQIDTDQNKDEDFHRCQASFNDEYSYDKYARDLFNRAKDKEKEMMMTRNPNISKEDYLRRDQKNAATFTSPYHHRESLIDRDSNGLKNFHSRGNRDHKSIDFGSLCTTNMLSSDYDTNYGLSYHRNSIGNQNNNHHNNNRVSSHKSYETDNRFLSVESIESPFQSNYNNRISGKTFPNRLTDRSCSVMNPPPASTMSLLKSSISAQNYNNNNNNNNNNDHHMNFNRNANHYNSNNSFPRLESNGSATTGGKTKTSRTKSMPISVLGVSLSAHELGHSNQSALKNLNGHNNHMVFTHNQHITGPNGFRKGIRGSISGVNHHNIGGQRLPPLNMCRTRSLFKGIKFKKFPRMLKNKLKF